LRTARGDHILIGRNGQQNDRVTFDLAGPEDLWLHARGLPGAHVILQWHGAPADHLLEAAAQLAAYYSPARTATAVEVDVAERRHVRKIKGGPPGLVTYRNERTVRVAPASEAILRQRGLLAPHA
jgi:predicted ribosome quality control (RQC) complex YloA/Tae2 family protein